MSAVQEETYPRHLGKTMASTTQANNRPKAEEHWSAPDPLTRGLSVMRFFTNKLDPNHAAAIYQTLPGPPIPIIFRSHSGRSFRAVSFLA